MRHNPDMTFYEAVGWTQRAARELAAKPPPTPREADDTGLSRSTWSPVVGYSMTDASAPIDAHMAAIQALRTHSRTQLNREEWEQAHKAILSQFKRETGRDEEHVVKPEYNVYVVFHAESLEALDRDPARASDEDVKTWDTVTVKPGLWLHIPKTREGNAPIWYGFPGEMPPKATVCYEPSGRKWWVLHDAATWPRIAANLEFSDPAASKFILKNMRAWAKQIGQSIPDHLPFTPGPILIDSPPLDKGVRIEVHASPYKGQKPGIWIDFPYSISLNQALKGVSIAAAGYLKDDKYWRVFPPSALYDLAGILRYYHFRTADVIRNHMDEWTERIKLGAAFEPSEPPKTTGDASKGTVSAGGGAYSWDFDKDNFRVLFAAPSADRAVTLTSDAGTGVAENRQTPSGQWRTSVPVANLETFAKNVERKHPALAAAVREHIPAWTAQKSTLKQSKEAGAAEGGSWRYTSGGAPTLTFELTDKAAKGALRWAGVAGKIVGGKGVVPLVNLPAAIAAMREQGGLTALADEMEKRRKAWNSDLKVGRGSSDGIKWSLSIPTGAIRLYIPDVKGAARLITGAEYEKDGEGWYVVFNEKRLPGAIKDVIGVKYPRLAEALNRAFGGAHAVMDEEAEACAKLAALSTARATKQGMMGAVEFDDVKVPEARAEVDAVAAKLAGAFPAGLTPYPYQVIGATFAQLSGYRCMIADEPGLGKTIQALACIALSPDELLPALVIAPASVSGAWLGQIARWLPKVPSWWLEETATPLPPPGFRGIVVASWDAMRSRKIEMLTYGFQFLVADEAHKGKNLGSSQTQAVRLLSMRPTEKEKADLPENAAPIPHVLFLSGTPVKNTVEDLWPQLSAINQDAWGKLARFREQYAVLTAKGEIPGYDRMSPEQQLRAAEAWEAQQNQALDSLRTRLSCTMIRRLKQDAVSLPPKYRTTVDVSMPPGMAGEYRQASAAFLRWLKEAVRAKLLEMGFDEATADDDALEAVSRAIKAEAIVRLGRLREIAGRGKIPAAIRMGKRLARAGEPFVYFCDHAEVVDALQKALKAEGIAFATIAGNTPIKKRNEAVEAFQGGKLSALICTTAAKEGITLTRAAVTLFVEHFWTAADEQQAEDRIHRISQTRPATIAYLHTPMTVDDFMHELVTGKRSLTAAIMGAEDVSEEGQKAAQEEAQGAVVQSLVSRLKLTEASIVDALREADPALSRWIDENEAAITGAVHVALYPNGPALEPEDHAIDKILQRLKEWAPTKQNPRRAWR